MDKIYQVSLGKRVAAALIHLSFFIMPPVVAFIGLLSKDDFLHSHAKQAWLFQIFVSAAFFCGSLAIVGLALACRWLGMLFLPDYMSMVWGLRLVVGAFLLVCCFTGVASLVLALKATSHALAGELYDYPTLPVTFCRKNN